MAQRDIWEKEYDSHRLMTSGDKPQPDTLDFFKHLRRYEGIRLADLRIIDLGCGTGRNSNYFAEEGAHVTGIEIARNALKLAQERAQAVGVRVNYIQGNLGEKSAFSSFPDASFDVAIDVMSSNSLTEAERAVYLREVARILKPGGKFYTKALCKDGDANAKNLIKMFPGSEHDTYIMPEIKLAERVWTKEDFTDYYSSLFNVDLLEKKTNYSKFNNQSYKRNFWLAYLTRK
jgi:SAM-dependent methyltransferase